MIGTSLLHYEITAKLGEGGMGVVWRARDTSLDREAAIKVLPPALAQDTERLARFEREAKLLASLNHPNIAAVYGLHQADGQRFIAMEMVGGEDLSERLGRGSIPTDEAVDIALGITRALEAAHSNGVVHRDLKPANIRITADSEVKVLDFGLAKAFDPDPGADSASLSLSPTLTAGHTVAGVILGTAAYMAPEQARGKPVDRRADIWALGVVVYEMLTGKRLFEGETVSDILAEVLKTEPDWEALPTDTPAALHRLLRRCLHRNPHNRLHDAADARIVLQDLVAGDEIEARAAAPARRIGPGPLIAAAAGGLVAGALLWSVVGPAKPTADRSQAPPVRRSQILLPEGRPLNAGDSITMSPDGSALAIAGGLSSDSQIYIRKLDAAVMEPIPGTQGGSYPFFSPSSEQLGFVADGALKTVSMRGGGSDITVLCGAPVPGGATWDESGWIYFIFGETRLARIREEGGEPESLGAVGEVHDLATLPGGRGILLTQQPADSPTTRKDEATISVLLPDGKTVKPILNGGYGARYIPSGHLVFMRAGGLFAVPFDLERLEASPPAVSVQPNVVTDSIWGAPRYDVSPDGTLVYVSGSDSARTVPTWIDLETGNEEPLQIPAGIYNTFNLSPDGSQLAIQNASGGEDQIFIHDTRRGTFTRLTLEGANIYPVWSADGREVFFASSRTGGYRLYRQPVDGSAPASRLLTEQQGAVFGSGARLPSSVTPDGKYLLLFSYSHADRGGDVWKVALDGSGQVEALVPTEANEIIPQISPDGRWLAYQSDRTGMSQVMLRPFPDVEQREWTVSGAAAYDARWSPSGSMLLYRSGWRSIMGVTISSEGPVSSEAEVIAGVPRNLIDLDFHDSAGSSFAVSPDGKRVLVNKPVNFSFKSETPLTLVTGWAGEVAQLVGSH